MQGLIRTTFKKIVNSLFAPMIWNVFHIKVLGTSIPTHL